MATTHTRRIGLATAIVASLMMTTFLGAVAYPTQKGNLECDPVTRLEELRAGADACTEIGVVVESAVDGDAATFTYAVDRSAGQPIAGLTVAGRGATFAGPIMKAFTENYNADSATSSAYGICGSSCGKRAFFGEPRSSDMFTLTRENRIVGENNHLGKPNGCAGLTDFLGNPLEGTAACTNWALFGASEAPLSAKDYGKVAAQYPGARVLHVPFALGTVAVTFNLPGFQPGELKLSGQLITEMYLGEVATWGDTKLVALNPRLEGNTVPITPVHRCDGSGTSFAFTDFLAKSSDKGWTANEIFADSDSVNEISFRKGGSVPAGKMLSVRTLCGDGNRGVAAKVQAHLGAFGYNELGTATEFGLPYAALENKDKNNFVVPSPETGQSAAAAARLDIPEAYGNWSAVSVAYVTGRDSYPATSFTYVITWGNPAQVVNSKTGARFADHWSAAEWAAFKDWLRYVLTDGQQFHEDLAISPIDAETQAKMLRAVDEFMNYGPEVEVSIPDVAEQGFPHLHHRVNVKGKASSATAITSEVFGVHNAAYSTVKAGDLNEGRANGQYVQVVEGLVDVLVPEIGPAGPTGGWAIKALDAEGNLFDARIPAAIAAFTGTPDVGTSVTLRGQAIDGVLVVREFAVGTTIVPVPPADLPSL